MADEVMRVQDRYYILSTSARLDDRTRVLKDGDTFAIFDRFGDVEQVGAGDLGLYHQDTRFLSRLALRLDGKRPLLLSSTVKDDNLLLTVDLTNADVWRDGTLAIPHGTVHFFRSKLLWQARCHERLHVHNFGASAVEFTLSVALDADFADVFEVRGVARRRRGERSPAVRTAAGLLLAYRGLDSRARQTRVRFDPAPDALDEALGATYRIRLEPGAETNFEWTIGFEVGDAGAGAPRGDPAVIGYDDAVQRALARLDSVRADEPRIVTSSEQFNDWLTRSQADLHMMRTDTPHGPYPYAGIPWFCTVFGRDGLITALECLWFNPTVARGVLQTLAATQADRDSPERDAQPGKVLHEARFGEMAALREVPFGRYYGSVDATPLFVLLAGAYLERTGDVDFARSMWPHVARALQWIDRCGDGDGDGFVDYARQSAQGLLHQGWKDSHDSVFHADGRMAEPPVALAEVQAYVYGARRAASAMAQSLGDPGQSQALAAQAEALRQRFEASFWCDDLGTYALALDRHKTPCRVRTSNAGHCLFAGIADPQRARRVAAALTDDNAFSGWGVRTVAAGEARFNPMSYHNGSVWPHDNALVAAGCARYGLKREAALILTGLADASACFELHRLPELFCGFPRRPGESPTLYPVSCAPQAWASATVFLLLQSCLGLRISAGRRQLTFADPVLPAFLDWVQIRGLRVGSAEVDLSIERHPHDVGVTVLRRIGDVRVVVSK